MMSQEASDIAKCQEAFWNGEMGHSWVTHQKLIDDMLQPFADHLVKAATDRAPHSVLDVGCGNGQTTRKVQAALSAETTCTGVDLSGTMVEHARTLALRDTNTAVFIQADASKHDFKHSNFDLIISRFGCMFFAEPDKAFTHLRNAASADAQLCLVVWGPREDNLFMTTVQHVAAEVLGPLAPTDPNAPGAFFLSDPAHASQIFDRAGWSNVSFERVEKTCRLPADKFDQFLEEMMPTGHDLSVLSPEKRADLRARIRAAYDAFIKGDQVSFQAHAWCITATAK